MGKIIKRKIALARFYKEIFKCTYDKEQMDIQDFEKEVNELIHNSQIRIGALLCKAIFQDNPIIAYPAMDESNEEKIVFYDLFNEDEKYMIANGEVSSLSKRCTLDVNMINEERKEELANVEEFYNRAYTLLGSKHSIPLTDNLSFDYSLASDAYYGVRDRFGNVSEIREIDDEYKRKPDTDTQFYINRGFPIATVDYRHMDEVCEIKNELDTLWESISKEEQKKINLK